MISPDIHCFAICACSSHLMFATQTDIATFTITTELATTITTATDFVFDTFIETDVVTVTQPVVEHDTLTSYITQITQVAERHLESVLDMVQRMYLTTPPMEDLPDIWLAEYGDAHFDSACYCIFESGGQPTGIEPAYSTSTLTVTSTIYVYTVAHQTEDVTQTVVLTDTLKPTESEIDVISETVLVTQTLNSSTSSSSSATPNTISSTSTPQSSSTTGTQSVPSSSSSSSGVSSTISRTTTTTTSVAPVCTPKNPIVNGDFETGSLSPWTQLSGTTVSVSVGSPGQPNSTYALHSGAIPISTLFAVNYSGTTAWTAGVAYTCTFSWEFATYNGGPCYIDVHIDGANVIEVSIRDSSKAAVWQTSTTNHFTPATSQPALQFRSVCGSGASGSNYLSLDNISCAPVVCVP